MPNQAGILAQGTVVGCCVHMPEIPGKVRNTRLGAYSVALIMFSDISYSIQPVALGQGKITVL